MGRHALEKLEAAKRYDALNGSHKELVGKRTCIWWQRVIGDRRVIKEAGKKARRPSQLQPLGYLKKDDYINIKSF